MCRIFIILLLFCWQLSFAQKFDFPRLVTSGNSIYSLTPSNWKVIDSVYGDLNQDKLVDLILIFEHDYPVKEKRAYGSQDTEIIEEFQQPRILGIYFKQVGKGYTLTTQNNDFVLRNKEGGAFGDPYEGLDINNNLMAIHFRGGANFRWSLTYHFKYDHQRWLLVRAKKLDYENSSGEMEEKDWDFVSRKLRLTKGNFQNEKNNKVTIINLTTTALRSFNTFKKPWTWEISKDEFL